ncbi:unnamed protein product [Larinioides sclopetarius]|uniref:Allorecognition 2 n=1 Tax=Larinioides sclopetarius TaxID=280406 RepID=A0AAV2BD09_9ARAC
MHIIKNFILIVVVTLFICTIVKSKEEVTKNNINEGKVTTDVTNEELSTDVTNEGKVTTNVTNEGKVTTNATNEEVSTVVTDEEISAVVTNEEVTEDVTNEEVTEDITNEEVTKDVTIGEEVTEKEYYCTKEAIILNGSDSGASTEYFEMDFTENCTIYTYPIKCVDASSIIKIKSIFTDHNDLASSNLTSQIQVVLKEKTTLSDGTKSLIDVKKWIIDSKNRTSTKDQIFFSQTADLTVTVKINGNWPDINLNFLYEEVDFGKDVFEGPPPLFISSLLSKKEIKINDENAYVVFVAASTRSLYSGFEITWKYNGTLITGKEDVTIDPAIDDESDSMPICIYNISAALNELNKSEDSFSKFRERLASLGNEYAKKNGKNVKIDSCVHVYCSSSQVRIVRVSAIIDKNDTLYVMVKIQHTEDGKAYFDWKQMGHILSEYSSLYHSEIENGYWINKCPVETRRKDQTHIIFYAIIPVICCLLFILIWNWKLTPCSKIFSKKIKTAIIKSRGSQFVSQDENDYIADYVSTTIPKVRITNDQGRRYTWDDDDDVLSSGAEHESDTVFNRADLRRSNSTRSSQRSTRSSTRSPRRPEINMAFEEDEEYKDDIQNTTGTSTAATNTMNSQKSLISRYITDETKL